MTISSRICNKRGKGHRDAIRLSADLYSQPTSNSYVEIADRYGWPYQRVTNAALHTRVSRTTEGQLCCPFTIPHRPTGKGHAVHSVVNPAGVYPDLPDGMVVVVGLLDSTNHMDTRADGMTNVAEREASSFFARGDFVQGQRWTRISILVDQFMQDAQVLRVALGVTPDATT